MPRPTRLLACALALSAVTASADDAANEARFLQQSRQLIYEGKRSGEGYFSPDGQRLIFQSEREAANPFYQIYVLDLQSGDTSRVTTGAGKTTCAFFQPGTARVLFSSTQLDPGAAAKQQAELDFRASGKQRRYSWDYDAAMDVFTAHGDGSQVQRLTDAAGYDAEASFSPDGKQIVFCSLRGAYGRELSAEEKARLEKDPAWFGDIFLMNADGSNVRQLTTAPGYDGGPFFSPDGQRILWRRFDASGMNADVFTMKLDGSEVRRLTEFQSMSWAPFFHPSGEYVIFTSNKQGFENFELFLVDAKGEREPVRITHTAGFDGLPVFSPDGKKLCWTSGRTSDGKSQLFLADWNDAAARAALAGAPIRKPGAGAGWSRSFSGTMGGAVGGAVVAAAPMAAEITAADLRGQVEWLAAEERGGRGTGSEGARATAEWLAQYLQAAGLQPMGADYFQPFEFEAGIKLVPGANQLTTVRDGQATVGALDTDFRPIPFSDSGEAEGEVIFVGYGLTVPEDGKNPSYNSYDGLDVKDKIVLALRYVPEGAEPGRRAQLNRYAGLRYKAMMARERGARAILFVNGPTSPGAGELVGLGGDGALAGSGVIAASINGALAEKLIAAAGKKLKEVQAGLDTENPHVEGAFLLPGVKVKLRTGLEHVHKPDRNVLALLPPVGTDEYVVVGAHYDHLGMGATGSSLARSGEEAKIHPGADDNASGTAAVMEMAANLAASASAERVAFRRGVIFALWSGEEIGIIGSAKFVEKPPVPLEKIVAYVNFDMVGRLKDNKLSVQAVGSSKVWRRLLEKRNVAAGFQLVLGEDPYLPTDVTAFYPKKIPVLNFFTGAHEDYHRPTDTAEKLDYAGTERIARLATQIVRDVATAPERPDFSRVERKTEAGGSRETLRAYLGTIPDYTTEVKGVKFSGVRAGSPAEKAGVQGGDVLVEFAGQKITNIYDYTYSLDAVKIGVPVKAVVERAGQRVEITVTPEARK